MVSAASDEKPAVTYFFFEREKASVSGNKNAAGRKVLNPARKMDLRMRREPLG